jgi:two-component system heavy metal sensor histidine kinase CusS
LRPWPKALSLRLALLFALSSVLLLGGIGLYLYQSLEKEIAWRDDQALAGRIDRMRALIDDTESLEALRRRPQLYGNMLGNRDSMLWIVDDRGQVQIEINPADVPVPVLPREDTGVHWQTTQTGAPARLAWMRVSGHDVGLTLIAGKLLAERNQMLAVYRMKLWLALGAGALLAFGLGLFISLNGMRPVRELAERAAAIDSRHLHLRLEEASEATELRALRAAFNQMLSRLETGFGQLSRFSEDLAHEMRTPLGNLMGQTQQALAHPRTIGEYQDLLASNQEEYERLARMVDNMLFLARSEQPSAIVRRSNIDLHELAEQLCDYFEGLAEERGMHLINHAQGVVSADAELLRRALANLIANALRYGAAGTPVLIESTPGSGQAAISVCNQGQAIASEHMPHLFERFYRADASRNQPGDSGGLGLAIVRSIAQLHGGGVSVHSDPDETRFTLIFPDRSAMAHETGGEGAAASASG